MTRAVYVLPPGSDPARFLGPATAAGATEIAVGIPPALAGVVTAADLPHLYVEDADPGLGDATAPEDDTPPPPAEGSAVMATVVDDDPLVIDVAGTQHPARRLQAYTPLIGDDVKATWLDGGWVVEDAIAPDTGTT